MTKKNFITDIIVTKAPSPIQQHYSLDLRDIEWHSHGAIGKIGLTPVARDLLEIARLVWEVEKYSPKRVSSQRVRSVEIEVPLRQADAWTHTAQMAFADTMRLLGNAEWKIHPRQRPKSAHTPLDDLAQEIECDAPKLNKIALFSGGLDSTCGLAWLAREKKHAHLASFYGARQKQAKIRDVFGSKAHLQMRCQWRSSHSRLGGLFQYRSFLFLSLGAAVAASHRATTIYQFENGPLALAMPPSAVYRMTRHAHPKLHTTASKLFKELFGHKISIKNPFLLLTKREMAELLRSQIDDDDILRGILLTTETCWNLNSRNIIGAIKKENGIPCGFCIPCLVRRTALDGDPLAHRIDFGNKKSPFFRNRNARIHVDAFLRWAERLADPEYSELQFELDMPWVVKEAIANGNGVVNSADACALYRRFADEVLQTFPAPQRAT